MVVLADGIIISHEGDQSFQQSYVGGFTCWYFLWLNLSAAEYAFQCQTLALADRAPNAEVCVGVCLPDRSVSCSYGRQTEHELVGALVGTLSSSDPPTSWPAYSVGCLAVYRWVTKQTVNAREADVVTSVHEASWKEWLCGLLFFQWICHGPIWASFISAVGLFFKAH